MKMKKQLYGSRTGYMMTEFLAAGDSCNLHQV